MNADVEGQLSAKEKKKKKQKEKKEQNQKKKEKKKERQQVAVAAAFPAATTAHLAVLLYIVIKSISICTSFVACI